MAVFCDRSVAFSSRRRGDGGRLRGVQRRRPRAHEARSELLRGRQYSREVGPPGPIYTALIQNYGTTKEEAADPANSILPPHIGDASDIAYGILYLSSDEAKFVKGEELIIDGGYAAHQPLRSTSAPATVGREK